MTLSNMRLDWFIGENEVEGEDIVARVGRVATGTAMGDGKDDSGMVPTEGWKDWN
jgi:hypothetical protein